MLFPTVQADCVRPAASGNARQLVLLLHGVGACGQYLMDRFAGWSTLLPDADFVAPNAPFAFDQMPVPDSYQWFSLTDINMENRLERVQAALPLLDRFIDEQLEARGLTDAQLALVGFSQGCIMSLAAGLRRSRPCAAVLGYSGVLLDGDAFYREVSAQPPTLLIHGTQDTIIPVEHLYQSERILSALRVPVLAWAVPGVGHSIPPMGEALGARFLAHRFSQGETDSDADLDAFVASLPEALNPWKLSRRYRGLDPSQEG
jgi:phospholipase/carboxylesterase